MLADAVGEVLGELSDREQEIDRLRFGLDGQSQLLHLGKRSRFHLK